MISKRVQMENQLARKANEQENGVEELVGMLSSLISDEQLQVLINHYPKETSEN
jgi:hypothetical protein